MRCASIWRPSGYAPLGLTIPATSRSQVRLLPSGSRETRPLPLVSHPYTERTRPIAPTLFRRESDAARSLANRCPAPVRAPRTRESVPVVATLTPRRAARRCFLPANARSLARRPAPVRAPWTRESVSAAITLSLRRSRRGVLPVGAALLSQARTFPVKSRSPVSSPAAARGRVDFFLSF